MTVIRAPRFSEKTTDDIRSLSIEELTNNLLSNGRTRQPEIFDKEAGYVPAGQPVAAENIINYRDQRFAFMRKRNEESMKPVRSFFQRWNVRKHVPEPRIPTGATVISTWQVDRYWQVLGGMISNEEGAFWDIQIYQYTASVAGEDYQTSKIPGLVVTDYRLMDWYRDFDLPNQTRLMWNITIPEIDTSGSSSEFLPPVKFLTPPSTWSNEPTSPEVLDDLHDRLVYLATPDVNGDM